MEIVAHRTSRSGKTFAPDLPPNLLKKLSSLLGSNFRNKGELVDTLLNEVKIINEKTISNKINSFLKYTKNQIKFELCCRMFADLIRSGWDITITRKPGLFIMNKPVFLDKNDKKKVYLSKRDEQILANQAFIKELEEPSNKNKKSIFEIIDDGKNLSECLLKVIKLPKKDQLNELKKIIKPEIIMCYPRSEEKTKFKDEEYVCPITKIKYNDIWKYFRLTWSSPYETTPGRSVQFIFRNAARKNKPVIGISMLASGFLRDGMRDTYIGWNNTDSIREKILKKEIDAKVLVKNLLSVINLKIKQLKLDDIKILNDKIINDPDKKIIQNLKYLLETEERLNKKLKDKRSREEARNYKTLFSKKQELQDWEWLVSQPDNKIKIIKEIIDLLTCRILFKKVGLESNPVKGLAMIFSSKNPLDKQHFSLALRFFADVKINDHGIDIGVCGPVDPYGEILGGKLITLLLSSKEIKNFFQRRYEHYKSPSTINSSKNGSPVYSKADLVYLTVSSLYGNSSMYNRIKLSKKDFPYLKKSIELERLKSDEENKTKGQGISQYSKTTTKLIQILRNKIEKETKVDGTFGQGASSKMRKTRGGLNLLFDKTKCTIRENDFIEHSITKNRYIFSQTDNLLNFFLTGKDKGQLNSSKEITYAWIERWVSKRICREETIKKLCNLGVESIRKNLNTK